MSDPRKIVKLNPRQREAVEHLHGPMLVVAGAGTGKTTVLTRRIAHLVESNHAAPGEILAVTYTEDAAREMQERVQALLGGADVRVQTFHSFCFGLLKRAGRDFGVLDEQDPWIYLRRRISELGLEYFIRAANVGKFLKDLWEFFSRCLDELKTAEDYRRFLEDAIARELPLPRVVKASALDRTPREETIARCREVARVYAKVEEMLAADRLGTYGHMITGAVRLLRQDPSILRDEKTRARFILIDEFQDANLAQIELAHLLAGDNGNVFAVGDPDQAIYRFRGATAGAFEEFLARFPKAATVSLEENQRSTPPILRCAFSSISHNPPIVRPRGANVRFERKELRSARAERARREGKQLPAPTVDVVITAGSQSREQEAAEVIRRIRELRDQHGVRWSDCAVLYRSHSNREELVRQLIDTQATRSVPFSVRRLDVFDTTPVRDLLAVLRCLVSPSDSIGLLRVASFPQFRLDGHRLRAELAKAGRRASFPSVLEKVPGGTAVLQQLQQAREAGQARGWQLVPLLDSVISSFRLGSHAAPIAAVREFAATWAEKPITSTGTIQEFLEYLEFFGQAGGMISLDTPAPDSVHLMTVHAAKGLEFPHVFILRATTGSFPLKYREPLFEFPVQLRDVRSPGDTNDHDVHEQEERRLFYVAMTRARDSLTLLAKQGRGKKDDSPPGFLRELLQEKPLIGALARRSAPPFTVEIHAAGVAPVSSVEPWVMLPPRDTPAGEPLSASAIETYERCPLQYKMQHDWRLPEEPFAPMQFGAAMHSALKNFYDAARDGRPLSREQLLESFRELLRGANIEDELQQHLYEREGVQQLTAFYGQATAAPAQVIATERPFTIKIGDVQVVGRMDRLDRLDGDRVSIVDYKTGSPKDQDDADASLQLSIYALAAQRAWKLEPERLVFYNLETNAPVVSTRTREQLAETEQRVRTVAENIRNQLFDPRPDWGVCRYCAYRELCPETEERLYTIHPAAKATGVH